MKSMSVSKSTLDQDRSFMYHLYAVPEIACRLLHLDNYMPAQDEPDVGNLEGEPAMEKLRRARVVIGHDKQNNPIVKWVSGKSPDELQLSIAHKLLENGRLDDFIQAHQSKHNSKATSHCVTFQVYAEEWMRLYKVPNLKPTTLSGYRSNLKCHIYPALGDIPLDKITTAAIQNWMNEHKYLAKNTLHTMQVLISEILQGAVEDKIISENPASSKRISNPSSTKKTRDALPQEVFADIISQIPSLSNSEDQCLMALLTLTGMRRGEALGLRWEDIDFDHGFVHVRRGITYSTNQPHATTTKSENGIRVIPMLEQLKPLISPHRAKGFIFGGEKAITAQAFKCRMERIKRQIDLHGATPHVFRHTFITMLERSGASIKTIQAIAGHGDIKTTMNRYVHAQQDQLALAGENLSAHLSSLVANQ